MILGVRGRAEKLGVSGDLAEEVMRLLIRSSLTTQEQVSVATHGAGSGRRALVIGGAGKMGGWFVQFLVSQGFDVQVADPAGRRPPGAVPGMRYRRLAQARRPAMPSTSSSWPRRWAPAA